MSEISGQSLPRAEDVVELQVGGSAVMQLHDGLSLMWTCYHNWGEGAFGGSHFCSYPWRQLAIMVDGKATACCVDAQGENSILVHGGANQEISEAQFSKACSQLGEADWVVLQNEINALAAVMEAARTQGSTIVLNPSPMEDSIHQLPLHAVDVFILNRSEGEALSGEREVERILDALRARYPRASTVLTLGDQGVRYVSEGERIVVPAEPVRAHDTTGAGDTFAGFFLAERYAGVDPTPALRTACRAAALCVTPLGAAASIPRRSELAQES